MLGLYTPYGGFNSASQISRKLGVFDQKLEESHYLFDYLFDIILGKFITNINLLFSSFIQLTIGIGIISYDLYIL